MYELKSPKMGANHYPSAEKMLRDVKGQVIPKCLFGIFNSSKKQKNKINQTTILPQVELFSFIFWKN